MVSYDHVASPRHPIETHPNKTFHCFDKSFQNREYFWEFPGMGILVPEKILREREFWKP